jgi:hypothetical protein
VNRADERLLSWLSSPGDRQALDAGAGDGPLSGLAHGARAGWRGGDFAKGFTGVMSQNGVWTANGRSPGGQRHVHVERGSPVASAFPVTNPVLGAQVRLSPSGALTGRSAGQRWHMGEMATSGKPI